MTAHPIATMTNGELCDLAGKLKAVEADAKDDLGAIKTELVKRLGKNAEAEGALTRIKLAEKMREGGLDDEARDLALSLLKADKPASWVLKHQKPDSIYIELRVSARTGLKRDIRDKEEAA